MRIILALLIFMLATACKEETATKKSYTLANTETENTPIANTETNSNSLSVVAEQTNSIYHQSKYSVYPIEAKCDSTTVSRSAGFRVSVSEILSESSFVDSLSGCAGVSGIVVYWADANGIIADSITVYDYRYSANKELLRITVPESVPGDPVPYETTPVIAIGDHITQLSWGMVLDYQLIAINGIVRFVNKNGHMANGNEYDFIVNPTSVGTVIFNMLNGKVIGVVRGNMDFQQYYALSSSRFEF